MAKKLSEDDYEINLIKWMPILWEGKWKIIAIIVVLTSFAFGIQSINYKNFTAETRIYPVTNADEYFFLNDQLGIIHKNKTFDIFTKQSLLNNYLEILNEKKLFEEAMHKYSLLDISQYSNEEEYNSAITNLASSIKILKKKEQNLTYNYIKFNHDDAEKWKAILQYVDISVNKRVRQKLLNSLESILILKQKKKDQSVEDLLLKINNLINDYDRVIIERLAYLKEQSAIAKELKIVKNTLRVESFTDNQVLLNISDPNTAPFYLRGYEAIDKEIELIELRTDKKPFIKGLFISEKKLRDITQNKLIERTKVVYASSPIFNSNFYAASVKIGTTKFKYKDKKMLVPAMVIGLIIGLFYVYISNELQLQKTTRNKKTN